MRLLFILLLLHKHQGSVRIDHISSHICSVIDDINIAILGCNSVIL